LNLPAGVAVDGSGNLFVADEANNRVVEVAANGTETTVGSKLATPLGLKYPVGVAVDANDNVFIADTFNNRVLEVPASGAPAIDVGKPKGAQLDQPTGVAVDVKGDVFVTDTGHNQIDELPVGANAFVVAAPSLKEPTGVAVDSAGNLFIADFGDNQVVEIGAHQIGPATTTAGELRAVQCMTCGTDTIGTGLDKPDAVAAGPNNKIFIADATGIIEVDRNTDPHIDIPFGTGIDQPVGIAVYIPATRPNEDAPGSPPVSLPANPNLP
jgi:streptogramin lyase